MRRTMEEDICSQMTMCRYTFKSNALLRHFIGMYFLQVIDSLYFNSLQFLAYSNVKWRHINIRIDMSIQLRLQNYSNYFRRAYCIMLKR